MRTSQNSAAFNDCYARWTDHDVTVGNSAIERRWTITESGRLQPSSLFDKTSAFEWIACPVGPSPTLKVRSAETRPSICVSARVGRPSCVSSEALVVQVSLNFGADEETFSFEIFPELPAIVISARAGGPSSLDHPPVDEPTSGPTGIETDGETRMEGVDGDMIDSFELRSRQTRLRHVLLMDRTDAHNEIVQEASYRLHPSEKHLALSGNLFAIEDIFDGQGIAFLKLAPLPWARPKPDAADLIISRHLKVRFCGFGLDDAGTGGYRCVLLTFQEGAAGLTAALQRFMRAIREYRPDRDGIFLSNTWGDRSRDGRISEAFLLEEIDAAAHLGIDAVQIDDGWQRGRTANSIVAGGVWENFNADDAFWTVHPDRLPHGLSPLVAAAKTHGIRLGLWFAPDSANDFQNWRRDADTLLGLHRAESIDYFKLDGIEIRSKLGEDRLLRLLDALREESNGRIVCDLDVTAQTRPGYFGAPEAGPIFLENRYTDWGNYWPYATLRNLWKLSHYMPPSQLRIEVLNNERNTDVYKADPLAPAAYDPAYLFAIAMLASPLGWFEVSQLSREYRASLVPIVSLWRSIRDRMHGGVTYPVGEEPDGTAWTGFLSVPADGVGGYLLAFREATDRAEFAFDLKRLIVAERSSTIAGNGTAQPTRGTLRVSIPRPQSFTLIEILT